MRKITITAAILAGLFAMPSMALAEMVDGEVKKVSPDTGKIAIKHGPIKKFDMDSMTMNFKAADPAMLSQVKPGDKIKFEVDKINGQFTVTKIEGKK